MKLHYLKGHDALCGVSNDRRTIHGTRKRNEVTCKICLAILNHELKLRKEIARLKREINILKKQPRLVNRA